MNKKRWFPTIDGRGTMPGLERLTKVLYKPGPTISGAYLSATRPTEIPIPIGSHKKP